MARFNYGMTSEKIDKLIKDGRGTGTGETYLPWLTCFDFPSRGLSTRQMGVKNAREHHLFSNAERKCFNIFQLCPVITDIREQFPLLPLTETETIANLLKIGHPRNSAKEKNSVVMTTDFVLTVNQGGREFTVARTVKARAELENQRTIEKFEIERRYWQSRQVSWGIIVADEIPDALAKNAGILINFYNLDPNEIPPATRKKIFTILSNLVTKEEGHPLSHLAARCDVQIGAAEGTSLKSSYHFIATRRWQFDWSLPLDPSKPGKFVPIVPRYEER